MEPPFGKHARRLLADLGYRLSDECRDNRGIIVRKNLATELKTQTTVWIHSILKEKHYKELLQWLKHRRVLNYKEIFFHERYIYLVSDISEKGGVLRYVDNHRIPVGRFRELLARKWTAEILEVLAAAHALGLHHNDFRWKHVDLDRNLQARIANFDQVTHVEHTSSAIPGRGLYRSPEGLTATCMTKEELSRAEAWTVGANVYELLLNKCIALEGLTKPLDRNFKITKHDMEHNIYSNVRNLRAILDTETAISDKAKAFVESVLVIDPRQRPTIEEVLSHPWIKGQSLPDELTMIRMNDHRSPPEYKTRLRDTLCHDPHHHHHHQRTTTTRATRRLNMMHAGTHRWPALSNTLQWVLQSFFHKQQPANKVPVPVSWQHDDHCKCPNDSSMAIWSNKWLSVSVIAALAVLSTIALISAYHSYSSVNVLVERNAFEKILMYAKYLIERLILVL